MKWILVLPVLLITGCAMFKTEPEPIFYRDWEALQQTLNSAPEPLRQELEQAVRPHLIEERPDAVPLSSVPKSPTETLETLLNHRPKKALRPDTDFKALQRVLEGETKDLSNSFSSALNAYLLDPTFHYQQPLYARYFQQRYANAPLSSASGLVPFYQVDRYEGGSIRWLDPHRVRSIHLLFAGPGENIVSRFGHVALRLVISPKETPEDNQAADENLYEHMVVGYMAQIDELEISTFKALKGDYQAFLFAVPFMDSYSGYTIGEFRELYSLPLNLSAAERTRIVRELSEIHWRFSADYSYFSGNCATLLQDALRVLIPEYKEEKPLKKKYKRPNRFFEAIQKTTLVMPDKLTSLEQAEHDGFYFSSTKPYYEKALGVLVKSMQKAPFSTLDEYIERFPEERMAAIVNDPIFFEDLYLHPYNLNAQILMEELALVRSERCLMQETIRYFKKVGFEKNRKAQEQLSAEEWQHYDALFLRPLRLLAKPLPRQDGIPTQTTAVQAEPFFPPDYTPPDPEQLSDLLRRVHPKQHGQWTRVMFASELVDETVNNIFILKEMLHEKN